MTAGRSPEGAPARAGAGRAGLVSRVGRRLAAAGVPSPEVDAGLLVEHAAARGGGDGVDLTLLDDLVARRLRREPLQLVVGHTWFRELQLTCRPGVFVPRPETEIVAGLAIDAAAGRWPAPVVVEPCTGTGAIALSLAVEVPGVTVVAADRAPAAVALARDNLAAVAAGEAGPAGLADGARCEIVTSDLLDGVERRLRGRVDVLVANPPYLPVADRGTLEPEVADHDPDDALVAGRDGLEVVAALLEAAPAWLAPGGTVVLEIDERRGDDAAALARGAGLVDVEVLADLTGADRALVGVHGE